MAVTGDEVLELVVVRIREVLGVGPDAAVLARAGAASWRDVRFDEDLHADSLDLVEIIEGSERELRRRGVSVQVGDAALAGVRAVGDAVEALVGGSAGRASRPRT